LSFPRLESETRTIDGIDYETSYAYDAAGNLRTMVYPTGQTVEYRPDPADPARIGSVVLNATQTLAANLAYKPFGPLAALTLGNGLAVTRTYDKNYQLLGISAGTVLGRAFTPDNVGNRKSQTHDTQADSCTYYPGTNRLQAVTGPHAELFQYDDDGNTTARIPGAAYHLGGEVRPEEGGSSGTPMQRSNASNFITYSLTVSLDFARCSSASKNLKAPVNQ
jgi:YD repeat-containing protein